MEIYNDAADRLSIAWFPHRVAKDEWAAVAVVQGSWRLSPEGCQLWHEPPEEGEPVPDMPLPRPPMFVDDDEAGPPRHGGDFAPFKPRADILVDAVAHAPGGQPTIGVPVAVGLGSWRKELLAVGTRTWKRGLLGSKPTDPEPFVSMPMHLGRAFGGPGHPKNRFGRGAESTELPNVEIPGRLVNKPSDKLPPGTFGPLPMDHPDRCQQLGTYDGHWLRTRWPAMPEDFDFAHFQAAPGDQQVEGYLVGDELLRLENLHPEHPVLACHLPAVRPRALVHMGSPMRRCARIRNGGWPDEGEWVEFDLKLDTLWTAPHEGVLHLIWRGVVPVSGPEMREWRQLYVGAEALHEEAAPKSAHVKRAEELAALRDKDFEFAALGTDEEMEAEAATAKPAQLPVDLFAAGGGEEDLAELNDVVARLEARVTSLDPEVGAQLALPVPPPKPTLGNLRAALTSEAPELVSTFGMDPAMLAALGGELAALGDEFAKLEAVADAAEKAKALEPGDLAAALEQDGPEALVGADLAKAQLAGADLRNVDLSDARLTGADLSGALLTGARLDGADLSGAELIGADLTGGSAVGADLSEVSLVGATLSGLVLRDAVLDDTDLSGAVLKGVDFTGCRLVNTRLEGVDWRGAVLVEAELAGLTLDGADFTGSNLRKADLSGCALAGARFENADLRSTYWAGAVAPGCVFPGASLHAADFEGADLTGSDFTGADAVGMRGGVGTLFCQCRFVRVDLSGAAVPEADFSGANLRGAILRDANLAACAMQRADLTCGDLTGAQLDGADLTDGILLKAKLFGASLARLDLTRADARGGVFYGAGMDQTVFHETRLEDADFGETLREAIGD